MGRHLPFDDAFRVPRRLFVLFLALTLAPAVALVYMGWRLANQDRVLSEQNLALEQQRHQKRRDQAADLIVTALHQKISAVQQQLGDPPTWPRLRTDNAHVIVLGVRQRLREASAEVFKAGEDDEYRAHDNPAAIGKFRELAASEDTAVRAGALLGLARNLRKASRFPEALAAYAELEKLSQAGVSDGLPADLVARWARCELLSFMKRDTELHQEATRLATDLDAGRWLLDGPVYSNYRSDVAQWVHDETPYAATEPLFKEWENSRSDPDSVSGTRLLGPEDASILLIWRSTEERIVIFMAGWDHLEQSWLSELRPLLDSQAVVLTLLDARSHTEEGSSQSVRTASDTGLPWTLSVSSSNSETDPSQSRATRGVLLAGLVLLLLVVLTGSYFVARLVHRELQVARLHSDFVAAVSHEFRTPLTALRQVTEILNDGRVADASRMNEYHQNQARATERLQRLVEMLLDFGRMEAGTRPYRMQPVELSEWIRDVVEDFQPEAAAHGHRIELQANGHPCTVEADPEALAHALRNLLDNAVKYSPGCDTVRVGLAREDAQYVIRVRDEGLGIPLEEQQQIFRKFVRGSTAKAHSIKGTGVGLAMVKHIVEAHHGRIHLESQPGKGSTFSMRLPENRS